MWTVLAYRLSLTPGAYTARHACIHPHTHTRTHTHIVKYTSACQLSAINSSSVPRNDTNLCVCVCVCVCLCVCVRESVCVCMGVRVCVCASVHLHSAICQLAVLPYTGVDDESDI